MSNPTLVRKPRASSQARIVGILAAARALLAEQGVAGLSIYNVAERAGIPPSSVYHFFASVPALLEGLTADIHGAFRACLQQPIEHAELRDWRDLSRIVELRMLAIYAEDAAARQLILAQHGLTEVTQADRQHDIELGKLMQALFERHYARAARGCRCVRPGHGAGRPRLCALGAAARHHHPTHGRGRHARLRCLPRSIPAAVPAEAANRTLSGTTPRMESRALLSNICRYLSDYKSINRIL